MYDYLHFTTFYNCKDYFIIFYGKSFIYLFLHIFYIEKLSTFVG